MKNVLRMPLRVVYYREGEDWVARCLELDLIGAGDSPQEAMDLLGEAIEVQVENMLRENSVDNLFTAAEPKYFRMYAQGKNSAKLVLSIARLSLDGFEVGDTDIREYNEDALCV